MSAVKLRVLRACCFRGQRCEVDDVLTVPVLEAASMVGSGRCELHDPADAKLIAEAGRADLRQQLREQGRSMPQPGSPWQPVAGGWH